MGCVCAHNCYSYLANINNSYMYMYTYTPLRNYETHIIPFSCHSPDGTVKTDMMWPLFHLAHHFGVQLHTSI